MDVHAMVALAISLICLGASIGAALGDSKVVSTTVESIARQPEMQGGLFTTMLVGVGLIESMPIIAIVIAFMLMAKL